MIRVHNDISSKWQKYLIAKSVANSSQEKVLFLCVASSSAEKHIGLISFTVSWCIAAPSAWSTEIVVSINLAFGLSNM